MLSIPHMIVVFLVVLVVFGPQKLPELARSFGKLMAEFRKASNDFKSAFEEEMRDLERQARIAELKKQVAEATAATNTAIKNSAEPAKPAPPASAPEPTEAPTGGRTAEPAVISPVAESVPRLDATNGEAVASSNGQSSTSDQATESTPSHDEQQPA